MTVKKLGRPPLPKAKAMTEMLSARFSPDEIKGIKAAVKTSGLQKTEWIRKCLLDAAQA